jgi:hypothetical protein
MGEWIKNCHAYRTDPCFVCECGWSSYATKITPKGLYSKTDSCSETCLRFKKYWQERVQKESKENVANKDNECRKVKTKKKKLITCA